MSIASIPIIVDLDGTLVHTDMLHESALKFFRADPLGVIQIPFWISQSRANLKKELATRTDFDPASIPYNLELVDWLRAQKAEGRRLILCTASDRKIADPIAQHLNIFDDVIASNGVTNFAGKEKARELERRYGTAGFDYAGNSEADLDVWPVARHAIVVNARSSLIKKANEVSTIEKIFPERSVGLREWGRVVRIHQWLKNFLLFVPLLAAHDLGNKNAWALLILALISFSLCASAVYIANDLLDLESDRLHPRKNARPFASGLIPVWKGVVLAPILLTISICIGYAVGVPFLSWVLFYFVLTCAYSWVLKRIVLIDCVTLALLYTLRIIAGAAAAGYVLSFWILALSVFLFLSLAFIKRYAELSVQLIAGNEKIHGRGYRTSDAALIQTMGIVSGYVAVLVLALYLNTETVTKLYRMPEVIWGAVPIMLFWISWMWIQAHRGKMHDDPLVFAVKDRASLIAGLVFAAVLTLGSVGFPW